MNKIREYLVKNFVLADEESIEYDGVQHYVIKNHIGGFERLVKQRNNDKIKTNYCLNNNIKLYRISYTDNLKNSVNDILDYIKYNFNNEI